MNVFSTIIELWKIPKWRSCMILGLYLLFFSAIFLYISFALKDTKESYQTSLEKFGSLKNYRYQIEINNEMIEGEVINSENIFTYQNQLYHEDKNNFIYPEILPYIDSSKIYEKLKNQTPYSKTEYEDSRVGKDYQLENEEIITVEKENKIYQVTIILSNLEFEIIYEY